MAATTIALTNIPSQTVTTTLSGKQARLWVRQLSSGLYVDVWLDETPFLMGALCLTGVPLIRNPASILPGELVFIDTEGNEDPDYTGLEKRWVLVYREND